MLTFLSIWFAVSLFLGALWVAVLSLRETKTERAYRLIRTNTRR